MSNNNDIVFELYKLCTVTLPEKNTWSIDEIYDHIFSKSQLQKTETIDELKETLKMLEEKGAIIFADSFNSINLVAPKLSELFDSSNRIEKY